MSINYYIQVFTLRLDVRCGLDMLAEAHLPSHKLVVPERQLALTSSMLFVAGCQHIADR